MNSTRSIFTSSFIYILICILSASNAFAATTLIDDSSNWNAFNGANISGTETAEGSGVFYYEFTHPNGAANGGFDTPLGEISFQQAGTISVTGSVPNNVAVALRFRLEWQGYPNTSPKADFNGVHYVEVVLDSDQTQTKTVTIPTQENRTFSNIVLTIPDSDETVIINSVEITHDDELPAEIAAGVSSSTIIYPDTWGTFGGTAVVDNVLTDPGINPWAGFESSRARGNTYPFTFNADGSIEFEAKVDDAAVPATVHFVLETGAYPNVKPRYITDSIEINSTTLQTYTLTIDSTKIYEYQEYYGLLFYIETDNVGVTLGKVTVNDDAYATDSPYANGVKFVFLDKKDNTEGNTTANDTDIFLSSSWVDVNSTELTEYSVTLPGYAGEYLSGGALGADTAFKALNMYFAGRGQAMVIKDVEIAVGDDTPYVGSGPDGIEFGDAYGKAQKDQSSPTYYVPDAAESWAGFATYNTEFGDGLVLDETITITFKAALSDLEFQDPFVINGELAFGDIDPTTGKGTINVGDDTSIDGDALNPRYWSAYMNRFAIDETGAQGDYQRGNAEDDITNLQAVWGEDGNGGSTLTLRPNSSKFDSWKESASETDGNTYVTQELRIEGTYPNLEEVTITNVSDLSKLVGKTVHFAGTVDIKDLDLSRYSLSAFIQYRDLSIPPDTGSNIVASSSVDIVADGDFNLTLDIPVPAIREDSEIGEIDPLVPSLGFVLEGRNAADDIWGEAEISNMVAYYTETDPIQGHFNGIDDNGQQAGSSYWDPNGGASPVYSSTDGVGTIKGSVRLSSLANDRGSKYLSSNGGVPQTFDVLGLETGATYDLSYYMKRSFGTDLGLVQIVFYEDDTVIESFPTNDPTAELNTTSATNTEWTEYSHSITTPSNANKALIKIYSPGYASVAFDEIKLSFTGYAPIYSNWAENTHGLTDADALFSADPDNDGVPNGLENFLGTDPNAASSGGISLANLVKSTNTLSMEHSKKSSSASDDVNTSYQWSSDLVTWNDNGATADGSTVTITTQDDSPTQGTTTATATVSGTDLDTVFIKVSISND